MSIWWFCYKYLPACAMPTGASRGPSGTEVNHHTGVENCTQILCKSGQYSQTLSHLSRPYWDFKAEGDEENVRIRQASLAFPSIFVLFCGPLNLKFLYIPPLLKHATKSQGLALALALFPWISACDSFPSLNANQAVQEEPEQILPSSPVPHCWLSLDYILLPPIILLLKSP